MKVLALRADYSGCAYYRIELPAHAAKFHDPGIEIEIRADLSVEGTRDRDGIAEVSEVKEDVDLIIFQRPLDNSFTAAIRQAQRQGIACIVELDDDFANVHPKNFVYDNVQPDKHIESNYMWVQEACKTADHVTVSTSELLKYAPHGRVSVLPNFAPAECISVTPQRTRFDARAPVVGWSGTLKTHPNDLQQTRPGVSQAVRDTGATFYVVGDGTGVRDALKLPRTVPVEHSGWVALPQYLQRIADNIDVGIVPLEDTPFNRAKSWLKGLEFASVGIPFVASPLPEYRTLQDEYGIGLLAGTPSEWRKHARMLIEEDDTREELGKEWQSMVHRELIYDDHGQLWTDAWQQAIDHRKKS